MKSTHVSLGGESRARDGRLTVLVSGWVVRRPVGGLAWHYVQYVLGLHRLGHRVIFMEDSGDVPSCWRPPPETQGLSSPGDEGAHPLAFSAMQRDAAYGLRFARDLFEGIGLPDQWCYYDAHTDRWEGPAGGSAMRLIAEADLLLNVSGAINLRPWHMGVPKRVLIDTDPVFSQARHRSVAGWLDCTLRHNVFFTFGENVGKTGCTIPDDGLPWLATRQPIVTDLWDDGAVPPGQTYTTVMSWKSYDPGRVDGRAYGLKSDSFQPFLFVPERAPVDLEIALDGPPPAWQRLGSAGWKLTNARVVTRTPWLYRDYIRRSRGEFSVSKEAYVSTRSGWFSERTAAYLAARRPVICQDTGFGDWLDVGRGVHSFQDVQGALDALESVESDYDVHAQAARELASAYFDAKAVLASLIDRAFGSDVPIPDPETLPGGGALKVLRTLEEAISEAVPSDGRIVLIDDNQLGVDGWLGGRRCAPFLEREGIFWGLPRDTDEALRELDRMSTDGFDHIVLTEASKWWLDHYLGLGGYLESHAEQVRAAMGFTIYRLGGGDLTQAIPGNE